MACTECSSAAAAAAAAHPVGVDDPSHEDGTLTVESVMTIISDQLSKKGRETLDLETLKPPKHISRGVSAAGVLRQFGTVFFPHPNTLCEEEKTRLFTRSHPTVHIDAFISHSWSSPGFPKYLSLLFDEVIGYSLLAAIISGGIVYAVQYNVADVPLLTYAVHGGFAPIFEVTQLSSPWEYLASVVAAIATLLVLPARLGRRCFFLDCFCIHQTDMALKLEGIRYLSGFLAMSGSMIVMWDDRTFSRLWCVYEIAVFRFLHPEAPIRIMPQRMYVALLLIASFVYAGTGLYVAIFPLVAPFGIITFYLLAGLCTLIVMTGSAIAGHDLARQRQKLNRQFDSFDAHEARCFAEADREEIFLTLEKIYGDIPSFNRVVRTCLKANVTKNLNLDQTNMLPYRMMVIGLVLPVTGFFFFGVSWFRREELSTQLSFALYMFTFWWVAFPLVSSWSLTAGGRLPLSSSTGLISTLRQFAGAYVVIGLKGSFWFIGVYTSLAFVGTLAIANVPDGTIIGLQQIDSIWVALVVNLPVYAMAVHTFDPSFGMFVALKAVIYRCRGKLFPFSWRKCTNANI